MSTGWNTNLSGLASNCIINLLGNEYWLEQCLPKLAHPLDYKPTGK